MIVFDHFLLALLYHVETAAHENKTMAILEILQGTQRLRDDSVWRPRANLAQILLVLR